MFGDKIYLSVNEAAEYIGCSPKTIRRRIQEGTIPAHTLGPASHSRRLIRIKKSALDMAFKRIPAYSFGGDLA